jgi:hypothetical protein
VIIGSSANQFPSAQVQVGLACEARPEHGSSELGESELDLFGDDAGRCKICCTVVANPIYKPLLESDSDGDREIFMVEGVEPPIEQTVEEIAWATNAEIA